MSRTIFAGVAAFALSGTFMIASADSRVTGLSGETGSVIVVRGGETFSLSAGDQLFDGDRVVTRAGATAEITTDGCTRTLPETSTIVIDGAFCEAVFASANETILAEVGEARGIGAAMPLAALGGLATAAAASGGRAGGRGRPSSR